MLSRACLLLAVVVALGCRSSDPAPPSENPDAAQPSENPDAAQPSEQAEAPAEPSEQAEADAEQPEPERIEGRTLQSWVDTALYWLRGGPDEGLDTSTYMQALRVLEKVWFTSADPASLALVR